MQLKEIARGALPLKILDCYYKLAEGYQKNQQNKTFLNRLLNSMCFA